MQQQESTKRYQGLSHDSMKDARLGLLDSSRQNSRLEVDMTPSRLWMLSLRKRKMSILFTILLVSCDAGWTMHHVCHHCILSTYFTAWYSVHAQQTIVVRRNINRFTWMVWIWSWWIRAIEVDCIWYSENFFFWFSVMKQSGKIYIYSCMKIQIFMR